MIICVSIAIVGTKLALFVILNGKPNGGIGTSLKDFLQPKTPGFCQSEGWMGRQCLQL